MFSRTSPSGKGQPARLAAYGISNGAPCSSSGIGGGASENQVSSDCRAFSGCRRAKRPASASMEFSAYAVPGSDCAKCQSSIRPSAPPLSSSSPSIAVRCPSAFGPLLPSGSTRRVTASRGVMYWACPVE